MSYLRLFPIILNMLSKGIALIFAFIEGKKAEQKKQLEKQNETLKKQSEVRPVRSHSDVKRRVQKLRK